ncbi:Uncharacterised protein [Bacillus cereus]|nr:Uncharacterised protein [Bacillus cereus]
MKDQNNLSRDTMWKQQYHVIQRMTGYSFTQSRQLEFSAGLLASLRFLIMKMYPFFQMRKKLKGQAIAHAKDADQI